MIRDYIELFIDSFIKDCKTIPDNLYECETLILDIAAEHNSVAPGIFYEVKLFESNVVIIFVVSTIKYQK